MQSACNCQETIQRLLTLLAKRDQQISDLETQLLQIKQAQLEEDAEKFQSPINHHYIEPDDLNDTSLQDEPKQILTNQIKQLSAQQPKSKENLNLKKHKIFCSNSKLSSQLPKKYILDTQEISNPLDDNILHSKLGTTSQRLFEEFFYLGGTTESIKLAIRKQKPVFQSEILYRFSAHKSIFKDDQYIKEELRVKGLGNQMMVNQFIFPFGVEIQKLSHIDLNSQLYEILFAKYPIDKNPNCFVIMTNQSDSSESDHNHLYYVCIRYTDFLCFQNQYYSHPRVVCISTKLPYIQFIMELLISFLNHVKLNRINKFNQLQDFKSVDCEFLDSYVDGLLINQLTRVALLPLPAYGKHYQTEFYGNVVKIQTDCPQNIVEVDWVTYDIQLCLYIKAIQHLLSSFTAQKLIQIFVSLLLEKTIVFVSKQSHLLTCAIMLFSKIILSPFKWVHPVICSINENYLSVLDSPVPIIVGIMKDPTFFEQNNLPLQYQDIIFVHLQESSVEFINSDQIPLISSELMSYLQDKLSMYFQLLPSAQESKGTLVENIYTLVLLSSSKQNLHQNQNHEQKFGCYKIIESFQLFLKQRIINNLPSRPIYNQQTKRLGDISSRSLLDYSRIADITVRNISQLGYSDKQLWIKFFQTQSFIYFLEQHYQQ